MVRLGIGTFLRWNITTAPVVFIAGGYITVFSLAVARQVSFCKLRFCFLQLILLHLQLYFPKGLLKGLKK